MNYSDIKIPTYVINLPERTDRRDSIVDTFAKHPEFELNIVPAIKCERGADGLWQSIIKIVKRVREGDDEVIIICEDDHVFTSDYNRDVFIQNVIDAGRQGCQILYGGIGNFHNAVYVSENRFWIDWNWCTHFMVVYRPVFDIIIEADFGKLDVADEFLSRIIPNKMVLYPFISVQKEFGYSDVTPSNNQVGKITQLFTDTAQRLDKLKNIYEKCHV